MYAEIKDIRNEGLTEEDYPDNWIACRLVLAQSLVDSLTRRFFEKREGLVFELNGAGHNTIWLPIAPVSISSISEVKIDDEVLEAENYKIVMPAFPDGRFNPKLFRINGTWPKGEYNIVITGDFGFVEPDESTPPLIKSLTTRIVIYGIGKLGENNSSKSASIIEEELEDYSYKLSEASTMGYFGDVQIDNLIATYRRKRILAI